MGSQKHVLGAYINLLRLPQGGQTWLPVVLSAASTVGVPLRSLFFSLRIYVPHIFINLNMCDAYVKLFSVVSMTI